MFINKTQNKINLLTGENKHNLSVFATSFIHFRVEMHKTDHCKSQFNFRTVDKSECTGNRARTTNRGHLRKIKTLFPFRFCFH